MGSKRRPVTKVYHKRKLLFLYLYANFQDPNAKRSKSTKRRKKFCGHSSVESQTRNQVDERKAYIGEVSPTAKDNMNPLPGINANSPPYP
ncbi:hypothetical protein L596_008404 [Steinernema carpocapsae]|uniref:Uncharacterized protein n=1 Tax=Steinernema carpocapsae TaxID=34508 RepID=A0A4U5PCW3_STECR|nr:hypothetical protein L596_008404 [Steinernema carpocapsae]